MMMKAKRIENKGPDMEHELQRPPLTIPAGTREQQGDWIMRNVLPEHKDNVVARWQEASIRNARLNGPEGRWPEVHLL